MPRSLEKRYGCDLCVRAVQTWRGYTGSHHWAPGVGGLNCNSVYPGWLLCLLYWTASAKDLLFFLHLNLHRQISWVGLNHYPERGKPWPGTPLAGHTQRSQPEGGLMRPEEDVCLQPPRLALLQAWGSRGSETLSMCRHTSKLSAVEMGHDGPTTSPLRKGNELNENIIRSKFNPRAMSWTTCQGTKADSVCIC